jgi:hypothetical protein
LQPDQVRAQDAGERPRDLGLAHAGLAFEQQRPLQRKREKDGGREVPVRQVSPLGEGRLQGVDVGGVCHALEYGGGSMAAGGGA